MPGRAPRVGKRRAAPDPWHPGFGGDGRQVPRAPRRCIVGRVSVSMPGRVAGDLHDLCGGLALADEPEDLVVAALDGIRGPTVAVF